MMNFVSRQKNNEGSSKSDYIVKGKCNENSELSRIRSQLEKITSKIQDEDEDEKVALDWKFAAHVLDTLVVAKYK